MCYRLVRVERPCGSNAFNVRKRGRRMRNAVASGLLLLAVAFAAHARAGESPAQPWFPKAPPLDKPQGNVIRVSSVEQLFQAADDVKRQYGLIFQAYHYAGPWIDMGFAVAFGLWIGSIYSGKKGGNSLPRVAAVIVGGLIGGGLVGLIGMSGAALP